MCSTTFSARWLHRALSLLGPQRIPSAVFGCRLVSQDASIASKAKSVTSQFVVNYPFTIEYYKNRVVPVVNLDKKIVDRAVLPGDVFNVPVRTDILHRVVRWQRAKRRQGTHKAKTRAEVSGGGRKPWKQKGTGRARAGSIRSPLWRKGGVIFPPVPRSHAHSLPKRVRRLGLKCALSAKINEGRLIVVDSLIVQPAKTKVFARKLDKLIQGSTHRSVLFIDSSKSGEEAGEPFRRASGNLPGVEAVPVIGANVYSILKRDYLIITKQAAELLVERLNRPINRLGKCGQRLLQWKLKNLQVHALQNMNSHGQNL